MSRLGVVALCLLVGLLAGCKAEKPIVETDATRESPSTLEPVSTDELLSIVHTRRGRPLVVHFWATWCPPCIEEWDVVQTLYSELGTNVERLTVSLDRREDRGKLEAFVAQHESHSRQLWWTSRDADALLEGIGGAWQGELPATFVFDTRGERKGAFLGSVEAGALEKTLEELGESGALGSAGSPRATSAPGTERILVAGAVPCLTAEATAPPRTHIKSLAARLQTQTGPTLLHLWAAWCVNCRHEWPELIAISDAYRKRGLKLLSVATDPPEGEDQLIDYLSSNPPNFPVFWLEEAPEELKAIVGESWDGSLPASFVFREGKMVWSRVGELSAEGVQVEFDELVEATP